MMQSYPVAMSILVLLIATVICGAKESVVPTPIAEEDKPFLLTYPNLENSDGEVVLTNEHVVLQRLVVGPGEWEGVHSHPGNQIFVHIKGGTWSERHGNAQSAPVHKEAGSVVWLDPVDSSEGHSVGNTGDTTLDFVLVTIK